MRWGVPTFSRVGVCAFVTAGTVVLTVGVSTVALAQTTQILSSPNSQVTDTMIRNGAYATFNNDGPLLLTRFSTVPDWERRTILTFETTSVPQGSVVSSAILTLTVRSGLGTSGSTRPVTAYRLTAAFNEAQATWRDRQSLVAWQTPGGDLGESYTTAAVSNVAGSKVSFNLTALVQRSVTGDFGSRQTRLALVDVGGGDNAKESYREYDSSESSSTGSRPVLTVVYGPPTNPLVIDVPAGGDLQQALNQVQPGGMVRLASGATFVGNFTLPAKGGTAFVVITTNAALPPAGTRIDPSYRAGLATIRSSNDYPALSTVASASYYRVVGVAFAPTSNGAGDIIALGDTHRRRRRRSLTISSSIASSSRGTPRSGRSGVSPRMPRTSLSSTQTSATSKRSDRTRRRLRLEYAGADHDPQQLSSRRRARTSCSGAPTSTSLVPVPERHRGRRQPDDEEPALARLVVDGQEHLRAEERAPRAHSGNILEHNWAPRRRASRWCSRRAIRAARTHGSSSKTWSSAATCCGAARPASICSATTTRPERAARAGAHHR